MASNKQASRKRKESKVFHKMPEHAQEHLHWNFPPAFPLHPGEHGLPKNFMEHPGDIDIESICGGIDESQPVEQYDGTLGVTVAFVNAHQAPVGQLQWNNNLASIYTNPGNVSGVRWCTGTLISRDLFLTAGHCFDQTGGGWNRPLVNGTSNIIPSAEIATNMHVNFNYQVDPAGNLRPEQQYAILQLAEYRLGGLDFAIIRLAGNPGDIFGWTPISITDAVDGDMLCIIQHPSGLPKRIEAGPAFHLHDVQIGYDSIDTLGGSSGSGILRSSDGIIVGVHTNGGCDNPAVSHNHGVRITSILAASPTITALTRPKLKFVDEPGGFKKVVDDPTGGIFKKAVDDPPMRFKKAVDDPPMRKFIDDPLIPIPGIPIPRPFGQNLGVTGGTPFILATPHHSMAWTGSVQAGGQEIGAAQYEATITQYELQLGELQRRLQRGASALAVLDQQYQSMLAEYQALIAEYQRMGLHR